jgi:hypothetical protein
MSLTKVTYAMIDGIAANVQDFGAVGDNTADDTAAIQAAIASNKNVYLPPTANAYKITAPIVLPDNCTVYMDGANITSTVAGIFRFPSGGTAVIYAANSVLQTNTSTAGAAISIVAGATTITGAFIYGFPLIIQANNLVNGASRGVDMSGFYRSYLEVQISNFYYGVYGDGDNGGALATYYNVLMKPDIRCGDQGYAIYLTNLCNATSIISPFISGGNVGYGGIVFEDSDACNVTGGYVEAFAANVGSFGIRLTNCAGITVTGLALDQTSGDATANYAIRLAGTTSGCSIINPQFGGSWNDSTRLLFNNASGKNTFLGNGYTNVFALGQSGVSLTTEGAFVSQLSNTTTSASVTFPSYKNFRGNEGLLMSTVVDAGSGASNYSSIFFGTGSPEGVYSAETGSIFMRKGGGANTSFYVKEAGTGNTGWVAK